MITIMRSGWLSIAYFVVVNFCKCAGHNPQMVSLKKLICKLFPSHFRPFHTSVCSDAHPMRIRSVCIRCALACVHISILQKRNNSFRRLGVYVNVTCIHARFISTPTAPWRASRKLFFATMFLWAYISTTGRDRSAQEGARKGEG